MKRSNFLSTWTWEFDRNFSSSKMNESHQWNHTDYIYNSNVNRLQLPNFNRFSYFFCLLFTVSTAAENKVNGCEGLFNPDFLYVQSFNHFTRKFNDGFFPSSNINKTQRNKDKWSEIRKNTCNTKHIPSQMMNVFDINVLGISIFHCHSLNVVDF